jgi:kinesin family member 12
MARRRSDAAAAAEPVRVVIRVRPMNKAERSVDSTAAVQVVSDGAVQLDLGNESSYSFACNGSFGEDTSQAAFFASSGIISLLDDTLAGYRATAFAHGQTSAGKTYTQLGSERASGTAQWDAEHGLGLLPRSLNYLFTQMQSLSAEGWLFNVRISCLEIYQENVYDLTVKGAHDRKSLVIREHPTLGFFVEGLSCTNVRSEATASTLVSAALANRHVGSHSMNSRSNRSHTLVTIYVDARAADSAVIRSGRITFIDLAGSERLRADATIGKAHRESCHINKSLYTLGKVVQRISSNTNNHSRSSSHRGSVPYRDSKLTMLLISSFGGKGRTLMIANIAPAKTMAKETYRTLCFALGVNRIRNQPVVTVVNPEQQIISELRHEVNRLRLENSELRQSLLSGPASNSSTCEDHHMTLEHLFDVHSSATDGNSITTTAAAGAVWSHIGNSKQQNDYTDDVDVSTTCSGIDTTATKGGGGIWSRTGINGRVSHRANVAATHNNGKQKQQQQQQQHRDTQQRDTSLHRQRKHTATTSRHHGAVVRPHTTCTTDSTTKRRHDAITASIAQTKSRLKQVTAQLIDAHANGDVTTEYKLAEEIKALQLEQKLQQQLHGLVQGTCGTPVAPAHSVTSNRSDKHGTAVTTATLTHDTSANTSSNNSDSGHNNMLSAWREQWQLAHSILTTPTSSAFRSSSHKPNSTSSNGIRSGVNGIHSLPGSSSSQRRDKRSSPHSSDKSAFSKCREKHFARAYPAAADRNQTTSADVHKRIGWGSSSDVQQQQQEQQQYRKQYNSSRDSSSVKDAHKQYVSSIMQQQRAAKTNGFIY